MTLSNLFIKKMGYALLPFALQSPLRDTSQITDDRLASDATAYIAYSSGPTIEQLIASGKQYDAVHKTYLVMFQLGDEKAIRPNSTDFLAEIGSQTLNSDAVVLGRPVARRSALTQSHHFIFSDYEFQVDAAYTSKTGLIPKGSALFVSRAGGNISLNGENIRAIETEFPLFRLDVQYLLFLHKLPSGSYMVTPKGAFLYEDGVLKEARNHPRTGTDKYSFNEIVNYILTSGSEQGSGK